MLLDLSEMNCCDPKTQTKKTGLLVIEDEVCGCGTPAITLEIDHECPNLVTFTITASNLPGGVATVTLQIFEDEEWAPTETPVSFDIVNGVNTFGPDPNDIPSGTYVFRLATGEIISNTVIVEVDCPVEPVFIMIGATYNCDPETSTVIWEVEGQDYPLNGTQLQIFVDGVWEDYGDPVDIEEDDAGVPYEFLIDFPAGTYDIRVVVGPATVLGTNQITGWLGCD